jgi:hypothetical protein
MDEWNDYVAVFLKDGTLITHFPNRILHQHRHFDNGYLHGADNFLNLQVHPEDRLKLFNLTQKINTFIASLKT